MTEEFKKIGVNTVTSTIGFTVQIGPGGGVLYHDGSREVRLESEWLVKPSLRILLYTRGFEKAAENEIIFSSIVRALEYMGYPVEVWSNDGLGIKAI
jgi:hypothetical protein